MVLICAGEFESGYIVTDQDPVIVVDMGDILIMDVGLKGLK